MTIGIYLLIILILGYISVFLRERFLEFKWMLPLTFLGIFIHESSHALLCLLTGGRVTGFRVTPHEGSVTHYRPKVPVLGPMLTAVAPMLVGLMVIGVISHFWLKTAITADSINVWQAMVKVLASLNPFQWQAWVLAVILLNIGVMLGPSIEDLKSIWPLVILSFFIHSQGLAQILTLVIALISVNILLFVLIIAVRIFLLKRRQKIEFVS